MFNSTSIIPFLPANDIGAIADLVSIGLVVILIWQFILLKKQVSHSEETTKLAHWPYVFPRYLFIPQVGPYLAFENIGTGSAVEVHISLSDPITGKEFPKFDTFALKPNEIRNTKVDLLHNKKVKIVGTYQNVLRESIEINTVFDYEKKKTEDSPPESNNSET